MQRFSLDRRRFAGHPRRGFPHPSGGSPSPSKSPPKGGKSAPRGAGACRPPVRPLASPSTPRGHPCGVPPASPAPPPAPVRQWKGMASEARRGGSPGGGLEKIKVVAPIAAVRPPAVEMWGRPGSRWAGVGAAGGQPPGCPRGVPAPVHGPRSAGRSRSDLHISTARGSHSAPSGGLFLPRRAHDFRSGSLVSTLACQVARRRRGFDKNRPDLLQKRAVSKKKPPESSQ